MEIPCLHRHNSPNKTLEGPQLRNRAQRAVRVRPHTSVRMLAWVKPAFSKQMLVRTPYKNVAEPEEPLLQLKQLCVQMRIHYKPVANHFHML